MAGPCARRSPRQNPPSTGKDELAGAAPTEGNGTPTPTLAVTRVPTPYSIIEMARTCACSSPRRNPSPVKRIIDKPADQAPGVSINYSGCRAPAPIPAHAHWLRCSSVQQKAIHRAVETTQRVPTDKQ